MDGIGENEEGGDNIEYGWTGLEKLKRGGTILNMGGQD